MTVTLHLHPDTESRLREKASRNGLSLEAYLQRLADRDAYGREGSPLEVPAPASLSPEEFQQQLTEFSEGLPPLPPLPADFSRADLYGDHD